MHGNYGKTRVFSSDDSGRVATITGDNFFHTAQNVKNLEFSALLPDVVTIADEVDAQLKEQILRFMVADAAAMARN